MKLKTIIPTLFAMSFILPSTTFACLSPPLEINLGSGGLSPQLKLTNLSGKLTASGGSIEFLENTFTCNPKHGQWSANGQRLGTGVQKVSSFEGADISQEKINSKWALKFKESSGKSFYAYCVTAKSNDRDVILATNVVRESHGDTPAQIYEYTGNIITTLRDDFGDPKLGDTGVSTGRGLTTGRGLSRGRSLGARNTTPQIGGYSRNSYGCGGAKVFNAAPDAGGSSTRKPAPSSRSAE